MNKAIGIIILLLAVIGGVLFAMSSGTPAQNQTGAAESDQAMMEKEDGAMMEADHDAMEAADGAMMEKEDDAMMQKDDAMVGDDAMMMQKDDAAAPAPATGLYAPYSADKLAMAADGDVVLFFKASWCPSCRTLDNNIKSNLGDIPAGVTILEVDFDSSTDLKKKYGVTSQHTLVQVDQNGNQVKKWRGGNTLDAVLGNII